MRLPRGAKCQREALAFLSKRTTVPGWRHYYGLPPKNWELQFELLGKDGRHHSVDGREWAYSSMARAEKWSLVLHPPEACTLTREMLQVAAGIIVEGEIGEMNCAKHIAAVEVRRDRPTDTENLADFASNFVRSFPDCDWADILSKKTAGSYQY